MLFYQKSSTQYAMTVAYFLGLRQYADWMTSHWRTWGRQNTWQDASWPVTISALPDAGRTCIYMSRIQIRTCWTLQLARHKDAAVLASVAASFRIQFLDRHCIVDTDNEFFRSSLMPPNDFWDKSRDHSRTAVSVVTERNAPTGMECGVYRETEIRWILSLSRVSPHPVTVPLPWPPSNGRVEMQTSVFAAVRRDLRVRSGTNPDFHEEGCNNILY